ncbi:MAG: hypothetical protein ACRDO8_06795 [Nocardioidaceae bacterium]
MATNRRTAGAFDIRAIIAALIGIYGVVLLLLGIFDDTRATQGEAPININLWAGIGMIVVAVAFVVWVRLRPVVVPKEFEEGE